MIVFEEVCKSFSEGGDILKSLSFSVETGETLVLLGKSGSGKTTLIRLVNRLIDPTSGKIYLNGQEVQLLDPIELRRKIGYAVQHVGLFPHLDVEENIGIIPKLLGWPAKAIRERVEYLLELVGLEPTEFSKRLPANLSGGQKQRVGVARALAADPPVILMDEPFGALDPITREQVQNEFIQLQAEIKKTILFVTHDISEAVKIGNRIALLHEGCLLQLATPRELIANPASEYVDQFLGKQRFHLSLITQRVGQLIDPGHDKESGHVLSKEHSLFEALQIFKMSARSSLPVYEGADCLGICSKQKIFDWIFSHLVIPFQKNKDIL